MTFILAIWSVLTTRIGLAAVIVAALLLFYEGLPLGPARLIPIVGPALSDLVDGRVDRARAAGSAEERAEWIESMRKLRAQIDAEKARAQSEIDKATRIYLEEKAAREAEAAANTELEAALAASEAAREDDTANDTGACGAPAISRGVSRALDAIGR